MRIHTKVKIKNKKCAVWRANLEDKKKRILYSYIYIYSIVKNSILRFKEMCFRVGSFFFFFFKAVLREILLGIRAVACLCLLCNLGHPVDVDNDLRFFYGRSRKHFNIIVKCSCLLTVNSSWLLLNWAKCDKLTFIYNHFQVILHVH